MVIMYRYFTAYPKTVAAFSLQDHFHKLIFGVLLDALVAVNKGRHIYIVYYKVKVTVIIEVCIR